jgi:REP element-mobilizing transposase RayT
MDTVSLQNQRRTIRLNGYDYTACGAYFITICAFEKRCAFGRVLDGAMQLNVYGKMVRNCWLAVPEHFPHVVLDEWVVMPNHFHEIVITRNVANVGAQHAAPLRQAPHVAPGSLGAIVRSFKSAVTRRINAHRTERNLPIVRVWQRNYYERIIRDQKELLDTRRYIIENPINWATNEKHPQQ